jgi:hypothetical protein
MKIIIIIIIISICLFFSLTITPITEPLTNPPPSQTTTAGPSPEATIAGPSPTKPPSESGLQTQVNMLSTQITTTNAIALEAKKKVDEITSEIDKLKKSLVERPKD